MPRQVVVVLLIALSVGVGFVVLTSKTPKPVASEPTAQPTADPRDTPRGRQRRVFCENHKADDAARAFIFKRALKSQRCDAVESALSPSPCSWTVRCSPGYTYSFAFDKDGELITAVRVR